MTVQRHCCCSVFPIQSQRLLLCWQSGQTCAVGPVVGCLATTNPVVVLAQAKMPDCRGITADAQVHFCCPREVAGGEMLGQIKQLTNPCGDGDILWNPRIRHVLSSPATELPSALLVHCHAQQLEGIAMLSSEVLHFSSEQRLSGELHYSVTLNAERDPPQLLMLGVSWATLNIRGSRFQSFSSDPPMCVLAFVVHRLNTILDSDRVLVMQAGRVAELDSPAHLSQKDGSLFQRLLHSRQQ